MILATFFIVVGLVLGSFGSVLITRLPEGKRITGRSMCPHCGEALRPIHLIPLVSFCISFGKCRACKAPISFLYPLVELSSGAVFLLAFVLNRDIPSSLFMGIALWLLLVISIIDFRTKTISDALSLPLCVAGIFYNYEIGALYYSGAMLGAAFFGALWAGSKGRAVGSGDIFLGAGIGFVVGSWQMMIVSIMTTYIIGALIVSGLLLAKKVQRKSMIPFAPLMALGAYLVVIFRDKIEVMLSIYF